MAITLTVLASLLQLHGPGATVQSDHQGLDALLSGVREQSLRQQSLQEQSLQEQSLPEVQGSQQGVVSDEPLATQVYFRRGAFARGPHAGGFRRGGYYPGAGAFRRAGYYPGAGAFRRGGFVRGY